jgi:phosphate:Na+ symporter
MMTFARPSFLRFAAIALALLPVPAIAQAKDPGSEVDWVAFSLSMLGGLALFLFGVELLAHSLKHLQGGRFQKLLARSSSNRFAALASGTVATVALDSSSVVIILLITIVDAGLVPFANALPVILGANIGTTFSSQVFAWNVDAYAPVLIAAGLLWKAIAKSDRTKEMARILIGLGLVLFALHIIGDAAEPLKENADIIAWLKQLENPLYGVLAGALVTIAIQSSSAMMGIVITLAGGGLITLPAGIAIMLGAEIGTCADTLLATLGRSRSALKAGLFHLGFNIVTVAIGVTLIALLTRFATATATDTGQQLANAHVLFNVAGALLVLPFVGTAAKLLDCIVPDRGGDDHAQADRQPVPQQ